MASNTNIQIAELDFSGIKNNLINYLKSQPVFKDYNFTGSALSVLLDILAYNTQYNAYYLNMVGNEMFLDTALLRNSVVSHAKLLDYTPRSNVAPTAIINITASNVTTSSLSLPKFTTFMSQAINGVNYKFVTTENYNSNVVNGTATFNNVILKEGTPVTYSFTVDSVSNPTYSFEIPDARIDTSSLNVLVQSNASNTYSQVFTLGTNFLFLNSNSTVYFLNEGLNGNYVLSFGDGIIGQQLSDGNIIKISYISTNGTSSLGANAFTLIDSISGFSNIIINPVLASSNGLDRETISSIKYTAPKAYASQGRAVTKDDYIVALQNNSLGIPFDAVNVWGGEENNPPVYGQVFVSLKPAGSYNLTATQKQKLVTNVLNPISVMTVTPTIVDPDYTYLKIVSNVLYDPNKTTLSESELQTLIQQVVYNYSINNLNTFNSTFSQSVLTTAITYADPSIIANEISLQIQKKFNPNLTTPTTYSLNFGIPLERGALFSGIGSSPALQYLDTTNKSNIIDGVYIEEVASFTGGIQSINITNPGFGYQAPPIVTILGDGTGATAQAVLNSGTITAINITNAGNNYTSAIVTITNAPGDNSGRLGYATPILEGQFGTLRSYYFNTQNVKTILNTNVGTIDYTNGIITLNNFNPYQVDNPLGQLTITANPTTMLISSSFNQIITVDPFDPTAISVNLTVKTT